MANQIKIGVSSCLLGEKVRWNGGHKQDRYIRDVLSKYFMYVPVCPEVDVGMGVPREAVALYGDLIKNRMIGKKSRIDWTSKMNLYINERLESLSKENLSGFIFKSKSPTCGLGRVPIYSTDDPKKARHGRGMFANSFMKGLPMIPIEEEGRLHDHQIKENFIIRVFSYFRLKEILLNKKAKSGTLVKFHTDHKFLLLAHSRKHYQILGRIVGDLKLYPWNEVLSNYISSFMEALKYKTTPKKNTDVLLHMIGFLKKIITKDDKKDILNAIEEYRQELVPLIVPITLIVHYVKKYNVDYLQDQIYLKPHPKELMLRNHV